jgi:hypothetical protein
MPQKLFIPPAEGTPAALVTNDTAGLERGWKTTEFWFAAVGMIATLIVMSDMLPQPGNPFADAVTKAIVAIANMYQIVSYIKHRTDLKKANIETTKEIEIARTTAPQQMVSIQADQVKVEESKV